MKFKTPAVAIAAFIAGAVAIPSVVGAQADESPTTEAPPVSVEAPESPELELDGPFDLSDLSEADLEELEGLEEYTPTAEDIEQWNAESDKLIEALRAAGVNVEVETDADGVRFPMFDEELTEADWEKIDGVFNDVLGDITDQGEFDFEDFEPSAEELAEWNAETDRIIDELKAAGIEVERMEEDGIVFFDFNDGDLTAEQEAALEEVFGDCPEEEDADHSEGTDETDV